MSRRSVDPLHEVIYESVDYSLFCSRVSIIGRDNVLIKLPAGRISDRVGRKALLLVTFGMIIIDYVAVIVRTH